MKKTLIWILVWALLMTPAAAYSAAACALFDPLTGRFLVDLQGDSSRGMASTTKLMTALVAAERYEPDREVEVRAEWCGIEGSSIYLRAGEILTVRALLYGLLLCSGNDAACALAGLDGDPAEFVARMNTRAAELHMEHTHFENPSGLDGASHYSTARDLCLLAQAVLEVPILREIVGTRHTQQAGRTMVNHNKLLADSGVLGLKTGFTRACGRCLVSAMERQGRVLIAVTLNAPDDWADHRALYEHAFEGMAERVLVSAGQCGQIPVAGMGSCALYLTDGFSAVLTDEERADVRITLHGPRICYADVTAGEPWGVVRVSLHGVPLYEGTVYYAENMVRPASGFWTRLRNLIS